ncbi:hypothetical protein [Aquirufa rosea]|uniref:Uncharacterized protein n=1 Tax=Aquirufa rosea TaxID=2509241 RepID=A0A4Q1BXB6_9BACT|nr:hypothetical protein [Aquirufa rosea]RXK46803.1 hypothetical protein ESB04_11595 [Aquirufa rosea]
MKLAHWFRLGILALIVWACQSLYIIDAQMAKTNFSATVDEGVLENIEIDEASGMVASRLNPELFWVVNDSQDLNRIFLIDRYGIGKVEFLLQGAQNRDWEDLAYWYKSPQESYVYVADIGDNRQEYGSYFIYRFKEFDISSTDMVTRIIKQVEKVEIVLPDGSKDMECMLVDQLNGDIYLISKRDDKKRLYRIKNEQFKSKSPVEAEFVRKLNFSQPSSELAVLKQLYNITAGDVASNNQEIIIRNYLEVYYWKKGKHESIAETLKRPPKIVPSKLEPQGEAIAFSYISDGFYTISEVASSPGPVHMYFTPKK